MKIIALNGVWSLMPGRKKKS